jgi:hypothetical protein
VACLETRVAIEPELRTQVEACAKAVLPPKNDDEAATVARAGDAIVPLLGYDPQFSAKEAGYCMQALVQIGSDAAMQQLVDYAKARFDPKEEGSSRISQALGRGYDAFAQETYIRQVLAHAQFLDLSGNAIQDLSPLSSLSQLQTLFLSGNAIQDLSPLSSLSQLQMLDLRGNAIQDLSSLSSLSQLQMLFLSGGAIQDLSPLSSLSQLQTLFLSGGAIQDLSPLSSLSQLQMLDLSGSQVHDFTSLTRLAQKVRLYLEQSQVEAAAPLKAMKNWQITI